MAQSPAEGITVTPSRVSATAAPGTAYGPFGLTNNTQSEFSVRVFPVLIKQDRTGGFLVRDDPASIADAMRYVRVRGDKFRFRPGASQNASGVLTRPTEDHNFYGGVLFRATPAPGSEAGQVQAIHQLNGALLLRPPAERQRISLESDGIRAEAGDGETLRVLVALRNSGNTDVTPRGSIQVRDSAGKVVAVSPLDEIQIIPGYVVDVPAVIGETLPQGEYAIDVRYGAGGKSLTASGSMELFGPNEVRSLDARVRAFRTPEFTEGDPVQVEARFENAGNVPFAPAAEVVASPTTVAGEETASVELDAEEVEPGDEGTISGEIELPADTQYELTLTIRDGERELDTSSVTVSPQPRQGIFTRAGNWVTDNAAVLVGVLLFALLGLAVAFALYVRRDPQPARSRPRAASTRAKPSGSSQAKRTTKRTGGKAGTRSGTKSSTRGSRAATRARSRRKSGK